jgi:hypothetical protein
LTALQERLRGLGTGVVLALVATVLAFFYPQYVESIEDAPLVGEFLPSLSSMVIMLVFTIISVVLILVLVFW